MSGINDDNKPKVSAIMGIYNCEITLPDAIESILSQSYNNWELIMCDDGSTDSTYAIAKSYQEKYPDKIVLLKNDKNLRLAASLNKCLSVSRGEYIARMDGDDESLPNRFEMEVSVLESNPEIMCVGTGLIVFDNEGEHGFRCTNEYPKRNSLVHGAPFSHPTIMMRKKAYDELHGYTVSPDTLRAEDIDLWFRFFSKGYKGYVIQQPLYRYRESVGDFNRRSMKAAIGTTKVCLRGYHLLQYPWYYYPYAMKPILMALIPKRMTYLYHKMKDKKKQHG